MRELPVVDADIRHAQTLPGVFYDDPDWFERQRVVLARSWHMAPIDRDAPAVGHVEPWLMLPGCADEPLVWTRDASGERRCLSNVCTHRGRIVCDVPGPREVLTCGYHGRCFDLDGSVRAAPGFEDVDGFPGRGDALPAVATGEWAGFAFGAVQPNVSFAEWIAPLERYLGCLRDRPMPATPDWCHDYEFEAHWALYLDNFLEGFHVPYVHPGLQRTLTNEYETHLLDDASVQVAFSRPGEPVLEFPAGHPLHGRAIAACFFFLFPCTLLNFYPWGVSINLIEPLGPRRTRVRYRQFVVDAALRDRGAGGDLETVEAEDQAVVLATQRGVRARLYDRGRYAPDEERAVHHFHRQLVAAMAACEREPGRGGV
ncbi:MAG: Rieske 2Fe-2S domain-containing protein [bacterium]|nr:Rieske 2Fe-2S domain-containing protein [bacterium]